MHRNVCSVTHEGGRENGKVDFSRLFLPSRREEGSSLVSIFSPFALFPPQHHCQGFIFLFLTPGDLTRMPSNTVAGTTAFKGSDYTDSPGNRMVRQMWEEAASGISIYGPPLGFTVNGDVSQRFMTAGFAKGRFG